MMTYSSSIRSSVILTSYCIVDALPLLLPFWIYTLQYHHSLPSSPPFHPPLFPSPTLGEKYFFFPWLLGRWRKFLGIRWPRFRKHDLLVLQFSSAFQKSLLKPLNWTNSNSSNLFSNNLTLSMKLSTLSEKVVLTSFVATLRFQLNQTGKPSLKLGNFTLQKCQHGFHINPWVTSSASF